MNIRFAVVSDLHIALPETIDDFHRRFHLTQFSIPALEVALQHLNTLNLDFLLLPGDLTQDGEIVNHRWLSQKLATLPYPVYVIPGNHDVPSLTGSETAIAFNHFPEYYKLFGYHDTNSMDYTCEIAENLQLIALNSNNFNSEKQLRGYLTDTQLIWLENTLKNLTNKVVFLMIHHNIIEHLPNQYHHPLGRRYMLDNAPDLLKILDKYNVQLIFTGHLHIQDIAQYKNIYEITTGSLITYPHPYRVLELKINNQQEINLKIQSYRVQELAEVENFANFSKEWMGDRSFPFIMKLLTDKPLNLPIKEAEKFAPHFKYFWANIANGDCLFDFPQLPDHINQHFQKFGAIDHSGKPKLIDNNTLISL